MLTRYFGSNIHNYLHLLGLFGLAFGIPLNKVVMSSGMVFLLLNFVLEAQFKKYWTNLISNKLFRLILAFYLLHILGILWSSNVDYALHDLKVKLPLLVIPFVLAARPVTNRKELHLVLSVFLISVFIVSFINYAMYQHWFGNHEYDDIRGMSLFSSHVRFSILVSMAAGIGLYFLKPLKKLRPLLLLLIAWFTFYTYYSQVISGFTTLLGVFVIFTIYLLWGKRKKLALTLLSLVVIASVGAIIWLVTPIKADPSTYANLPEYTAEGNKYSHYKEMISPETGKPIYLYLCEYELERDWPNRSSIDYFDLDEKGQPIRFTLLRYLSSKDLHKDAIGLSQLSDDEIKKIEQGVGSANNYGILGRLYGIKYEIINEHDPNGNSLLERIEYWKAGISIFSHNIMIGVGTGDVQDAFNAYYVKSNSPLFEENRNRTHNMFLTIALTFGIFGLLFFILLLGKFILHNIRNKEVIALLFITIAIVSFLMEDTLETQTGVTFFGLFYGLYSSRIVEVSEPSDRA